MTVRTITIIDDLGDELQLFVNTENKLYLQIEDFDNGNIQAVTLCKDDAIQLRDELNDLIENIE